MIIAVDASGAVSLQEADNFRGFKVVSAIRDKDALARALAAAGRFDGEHAWITASWLTRTASGDDAWQTGFGKMVAFAQSKGWVENDAIRAHIEYAG